MRTRRVVIGLAALGMVAGFGYWLGNYWDGQPRLPTAREGCVAEADGRVRLDVEQMANAATVAAVGVRLDMPDRGVTVALATALQESKLRNLPHLGDGNDHDSVGLFQQRPSQGWGSEKELGDPRIASERFYQSLRQVDGWQDLRITEAAQRVQRSAYPEAYQRWTDHAKVLAIALLGKANGAVTCTVPRGDPPDQADAEAAAATLSEQMAQDWGDQIAVAPADSAGLSVSADDDPAGWRYANWLVSHAASHGVTRVQFADLEWTADDGGWSTTDSAIDHVRVEVTRS